MKFNFRKYVVISLTAVLVYFVINAFRIYTYSSVYFETKSDVAIVLGAGTKNDKLSPVFTERINHSLILYQKGLIKKIIFTGGFGENEEQSDSQIAKAYAIECGIPEVDIFIEEKSRFTVENLFESKLILDSIGLKTVLLISDPLHMKRAMLLADQYAIDCKPSPTKTSMYQSVKSKSKSLLYETFYFSIREIMGVFNEE